MRDFAHSLCGPDCSQGECCELCATKVFCSSAIQALKDSLQALATGCGAAPFLLARERQLANAWVHQPAALQRNMCSMPHSNAAASALPAPGLASASQATSRHVHTELCIHQSLQQSIACQP